MPFRFKLDEPIEKGFRRIGTEQIERARRQVSAGADAVTEIHEARKALKRVRALLRIGRNGLGEPVFQAENARFRALAATLAPARDQHVVSQTLAVLAATAQPAAEGAISRFRKAISASNGSATEPIDRSHAERELDRAQQRFRRLRLDPDEFATIQSGMIRSYRRARKHFALAYRSGDDEAFHTWRKGVQAYWRHMALLSSAWTDHFQANVAAARELSQLLGDDHDLALLTMALASLPAGILSEADRAAVTMVIQQRQRRLRMAASPRGELLFSEKPEILSRRIGTLWHAGTAKRRVDRVIEEADELERRAPQRLAGE
jgi:hypothetical protein